jgi:GTPase SAR1 family protein
MNRDRQSRKNFKYNYKIVLIGDSGVGKTLMLNRFVHQKIPAKSVPTIGIEFATKTITLQNGKKMMTQIWDTGKFLSSTLSNSFSRLGKIQIDFQDHVQRR